MKKKRSGGLIAGIIIIVACIVGLFLVGGLTASLLKTLLTIAIILVIAAILLSILIIGLARKAGSQSAAPGSQIKRDEPLTKEQADSLNKASSQLTSIRMTLSRLEDKEIAEAGIKAVGSIEKVLHAL
ncbi:MAG: hypothetical protein Q4D46_04925, partial [Erysipelotrichaceae bacterium]|nr:hypothetical protein [Erysipelotrichaceae bacterium]